MNRFIDVTPSQCIGCRTCEVVCALSHAGAPAAAAGAASDSDAADLLASLGYAPRLKVIKADNVCMPVTCHHCDDAPCAGACPTAAISQVQDTIQIDPGRCIGCKSCMIACPYGMIEVVATPVSRPFAGVRLAMGTIARAQKCDLCIDRARGPACVAACPTVALHIATGPDIDALIQERRLETMRKAVEAETTA